MGVGKTAVCRALQKRLDRSVFLDGLLSRLTPEEAAARLEVCL